MSTAPGMIETINTAQRSPKDRDKRVLEFYLGNQETQLTPQQIADQIEAEIDLMARAIEAELEKNDRDDELKLELEKIKEIQKELQVRPEDDHEGKIKFTKAIEAVTDLKASNSKAFKELEGLKALASRATESSKPQDLDQFKREARAYLSNIAANSRDISKETTDKIMEGIRPLSEMDKNLPNLGFWNTLVFRARLFFQKNDANWAFDYLIKTKQFDGDGKMVLAYLRKNCKGLIEKHGEQIQKLEKKYAPLPERNIAEEVKSPVVPEVQLTGIRDKKKEPEPEKPAIPITLTEQITEVKDSKGNRSALEMLEKGASNSRVTETQKVTNEVLEELNKQEQETTPRERMRYAYNIVTDKMLRKNIPFTQDQIDQVFENIVVTLDEPLNESQKKELEILKGTLRDIRKDKEAQTEILRGWYLAAKTSADKQPDLTPEAKGEFIEREISKRYLREIIDYQIAQYTFLTRTGSIEAQFNENGTRRMLEQAIETGAIKLTFHEDAYGKRIPTFMVEDLVLEGGNVISSRILMNLLNGANGRQLNKALANEEHPSPTGLFITTGKDMPTIVCVDIASINKTRDPQGHPLPPQYIDRVIAHEIMHAHNWGERALRRSYLTNRMEIGTLEGKWVDKLVEGIRTELKDDPEFNQMDPRAQERSIRQQLESYIRNEGFEQGANNQYYGFFEQNRTASRLQQHYADLQEDMMGNEIDEITAEAMDMMYPLTLGDLGIDKARFDRMSEREKEGLMGMIRVFNELHTKREVSTDEITKSKLDNDITALALYLSSYFEHNKPDGRQLEQLYDKALEDKNHPMHRVMEHFKNKEAFLALLKGELHDDEIGEVFDLGGLFRASNSDSSLRWAATRHKDAFYFGAGGTRGRMGGGPLGAKLDIFSPVAWLHTKDKGPGIFQIPSAALSKKNFMDGFGLGVNRFRTDSSDGLEAISFLTGIPVHRLPFLQNLPNWLNEKTGGRIDLDKSAWAPKGLFTGSPDMYVYYVQKVIYGRMRAEHKVDNQALIKLLPEIGGYDYDTQGNPVETIYSYADRADQYRLNSELADFILNELIHTERHTRRRGSGYSTQRDENGRLMPIEFEDRNRDDLREIAERLKTDTIYHRGNWTQIVYRDGYVLTKDFADSLDPNRSVTSQLSDPDIAARSGNGIVRKGQLRMGQMSRNVLDEIKEIMWIPQTSAPRQILNPFGLAAMGQNKGLDSARGNVGKIKDYERIAELMMKEDARRREEEDGAYTLTDLYEEMARAQMQPWNDLYQDGQENQDAIERYENPKMLIGGEYVDLNTAKEFFKDYSMARAHKVMAVGVWGRDVDYDTQKPGDFFNPTEKIPFKARAADGTETIQDLSLAEFREKIMREGPQTLEALGFEMIEPSQAEEGVEGYYFRRQWQGQEEIYFMETTSRMGGVEVPKSFKKVLSTRAKYSKDAKLKIENKMTGYTLDINPIRNLNETELIRYFGEKQTYTVHYRDKQGNIHTREVTARNKYDTQYGTLYDDVLDELDKIRRGRDLSYRFSLKLNQISSYREHSKVHREFYEGLLMIDNTTRFFILAGAVIGSLVPSLVFLANPYLVLGTLAMAIGVNPFLNRYAKGWGAREIAAIQEQGSLGDMAGIFWGLTNESQPPSYGQLDLAASTFEGIKFKYRSLLKNFGDASFNSNFWTDLFLDLWGRVSTKPY
jgi:hypothetical protein